MATFPTIYLHSTFVQNPQVGDFNETMAHNPVIKGEFEGGYTQTRARFTRVTRKWTCRYDGVSQANKNTIRAFEDARLAGAESFTWTNPEDSVAYTVRFYEPVIYTPWPKQAFTRWTIEFVLEQV